MRWFCQRPSSFCLESCGKILAVWGACFGRWAQRTSLERPPQASVYSSWSVGWWNAKSWRYVGYRVKRRTVPMVPTDPPWSFLARCPDFIVTRRWWICFTWLWRSRFPKKMAANHNQAKPKQMEYLPFPNFSVWRSKKTKLCHVATGRLRLWWWIWIFESCLGTGKQKPKPQKLGFLKPPLHTK